MAHLVLPWRRYGTPALIAFLLFLNSSLYASDETVVNDADGARLTLDTDVVVPDGLWETPREPLLVTPEPGLDEIPREEASSSDPAPSATLALPPPLDPPPLKAFAVMLDWYLSPQHAALVIAKERELFEDQGLDVELLSPADPTLPLKLLAAGEVELALTREPILHLQAHAGEPLVRVGTLVETPLNAVIVTRSTASVDEPASLAGLRYGFSTREGESVVAERLVPQSIRQTDDFVEPVNVHFDAAAAVVDGRVDVIADGYYATLPDQLAPEGIDSRVIHYEEIDIPRHDGLVVVANATTLAHTVQSIARFMTAVEQASHWMIDNPEAAWALVTERHPILDNEVNQAGWEALLRRMSLSPAAVNTRRYQAFEAYLLSRGIIETVLPVSRLAIDPHALQE
ncbi:ABC transporter substrate-binding protein [Halomonas malpeensis]|uniref:ABC transporter substrate-binding protein n=1 Tax=Vreelandella malpeensis TaxID=1172368 RepID=A0ABS8DU12_9GAMM|nr:ABC transporter substrate-binding protein [Halomonas malpeensis]